MDDFMGAMITERERLRRLSDQLERLVELTDQVNPETTPLEVILAFTKRQIIRLDDLIEIYDAGPPRNRSLN